MSPIAGTPAACVCVCVCVCVCACVHVCKGKGGTNLGRFAHNADVKFAQSQKKLDQLTRYSLSVNCSYVP